MELESLKYIWRSLESPSAGEVDREVLLALLQKKSRGPVARMRRNLQGELLLLVITYVPGILFYLLELEGRLSAISGLLLLLGALFGIYYYRKHRLLDKMLNLSGEVRSNLALQVATLKKYIRFYLLTGTLMIPVMALLSYGLYQWKFPPPPGLTLLHRLHPAPWWTNPALWLIFLAPLTIGIYFFNVWYVNRLYGRHIKKLQELLREMDED